jgi:hypothetical protein
VDGPPTSAPAGSGLTAAVHALLRTGLPTTDDGALDGLLAQPGAATRAVDPADRSSRLRALDGWLRWALARFEPPRLAEAARLLFGAAPGTAGLTLTERRAKAAASAGYEAHHFRKRIEPRICERLAAVLAADSAEAAVRAVPPRLARPRRPLQLPADVFAWEAAEHEQALSELWAGVYALRGALLAVARLAGMHSAEHPETEAAAETALWRSALLHRAVLAYRDAYGPQLLGADPGTGPDDLAGLAGWQPTLDPHVLDQLAVAADDIRPGGPGLPATAPASTLDAARAWRRELADASTDTVRPKEQEPWT